MRISKYLNERIDSLAAVDLPIDVIQLLKKAKVTPAHARTDAQRNLLWVSTTDLSISDQSIQILMKAKLKDAKFIAISSDGGILNVVFRASIPVKKTSWN